MSQSKHFNLEEVYKKFEGILKDAEQGKLVTRFPPEPSGYMHIGHVKAAMLNYHYSRMYNGQFIFRFDDTNPSKENDEFTESIKEDMHRLGLKYDKLSYTSDYFEYYIQKAEEMIMNGDAYVDNTPAEQMKQMRTAKIPSPFRDTPAEENLRIFREMLKAKQNPGPGEVNYAAYCLRGKIDYTNDNGVLRDPVFYRVNFDPHHRTGTKYVCYPTYDFCCPLVDSLEGVTHAMRSNEYADRIHLYYWVLKKANVREVKLWQFSRLNFVNTLMSKRKLQWFVDTKRVEGWHDPRMPTVRGILRRGLRVETLTKFMLEQGPSQQINLMEWDKIWSTNKDIIDPIAPRFHAVKQNKAGLIKLTNVENKIHQVDVQINPLNKDMGQRPFFYSPNLLIDYDDAIAISGSEKITCMGLGNVQIKSKTETDTGIVFEGEFLPEDKKFKDTQKITFLCKDTKNVQVNLIELDHLIKVKKLEEEDSLDGVINEPSKFETLAWAEPAFDSLKEDDVLQFQRKGYFRVDKVYEKDGVKTFDCIYTPDGKASGFTKNLIQNVDSSQLMGGKNEREAKPKVELSQAAELAASKKQDKKQKVEQKPAFQIPSPFVINPENLQGLNSVLQKQLYLSGKQLPSELDFSVFKVLKSAKYIPQDQHIYIYAWYGNINNFKQ